jgi:hypothetical protein
MSTFFNPGARFRRMNQRNGRLEGGMTHRNGDQDTQEESLEAFFRFHARDAHRPPADSLWSMTPLCPPKTVDALEAARQLHHDIRQWVADGGFDPQAVEFRSGPKAKKSHDGRTPLAQIAWTKGPKDWPAGLMEGRSYASDGVFLHDGKRYYLEPSRFVLDMMPLD